jgi:hypothetical protein
LSANADRRDCTQACDYDVVNTDHLFQFNLGRWIVAAG